MPHCVLWCPATWEFAFTALELVAHVHEGRSELAAELRAWERVLGTTEEARIGQRIRYEDPAPVSDEPAAVANIADYRDL